MQLCLVFLLVHYFLIKSPACGFFDHAVAIVLALVVIATDLKIFVDIFVYNELPFH